MMPENTFNLTEAGITANALRGFVRINETNFPDVNFREYVLTLDTDGDGSLSEEEINAVTEINVSSSNISNLDGIEFFTALTYLNCNNNQLTSLDLSKNTALKKLSCYSNPSLTSIKFANNKASAEFYHDCHNVTVEGKDPTCTETGLTEGTKCSLCGKTTQKEISATGHTDENSDTRCDVCNDAIGVVLNEVSATLEGDIGMNYYITLPQSVTSDTGAYVQFTVNGESTKESIPAPEADGTYKFTYRMNAKEMHDKVTFEVYDGNGNPVDLYFLTIWG